MTHPPIKIDPNNLQEAVLRAKARIAEQQAEKARKQGLHLHLNIVTGAAKEAARDLALQTPKKVEADHDDILGLDDLLDSYCPGVHYDLWWLTSPPNGHPVVSTALAVPEKEITPIIFLDRTPQIPVGGGWHWNSEQSEAIKYGTKRIGEGRENFCIIGAAGTGKTTTLKGLLRAGMEMNLYPPMEKGTKWLSLGAPGIVLVSYTRRAVRNIARQMSRDLKDHCLTVHKLIEFGPEFYEADIIDEKTGMIVGAKTKMKFAPQRHSGDPLPRNLTTIVIDEASMLDTKLFGQLCDAIPNLARVQFIVLGDLNQLPPVYGQAILGEMLLKYPIIELTQVYRQALESPIIALALAVKDNNFSLFNKQIADGTFTTQFRTAASPTDVRFRDYDPATDKVDIKNIPPQGGQLIVSKAGRGKVTLHPWKQKFDQDTSLTLMKGQINSWIETGEYLPDEDLILCPWNESFGTEELNSSIANKLGIMRGADVYEVIAGFQKHYLAVGDKLLIDKHDCVVLEITRNPKYLGKRPMLHSKELDRWGKYRRKPTEGQEADAVLSDADIDNILSMANEITDRTAEASHCVKVKMVDSEEDIVISKSATFNAGTGGIFAYAITVHKAQGSECRKVFFLTHYCHSQMLSRELVYTAITRAAEELYIVMSPQMLATSAAKPRIKGDTLAAKLAWYQEKMKERMA